MSAMSRRARRARSDQPRGPSTIRRLSCDVCRLRWSLPPTRPHGCLSPFASRHPRDEEHYLHPYESRRSGSRSSTWFPPAPSSAPPTTPRSVGKSPTSAARSDGRRSLYLGQSGPTRTETFPRGVATSSSAHPLHRNPQLVDPGRADEGKLLEVTRSDQVFVSSRERRGRWSRSRVSSAYRLMSAREE
jgi:hypothetical protein